MIAHCNDFCLWVYVLVDGAFWGFAGASWQDTTGLPFCLQLLSAHPEASRLRISFFSRKMQRHLVAVSEIGLELESLVIVGEGVPALA